jgi:hypothetical protein
MIWTRVTPAGGDSLGVEGAAESGFEVLALGGVVEIVAVAAVVADVEPLSVDEASAGAADVEVPSTAGVAESVGVDDDVVSADAAAVVLASVDVP